MKKARSMGRVNIPKLMVMYMKEITKMTGGMGRVNIPMLMVMYMK